MRPSDDSSDEELYECPECGGRETDPETPTCGNCGTDLLNISRSRDL